MPAVTNNKEIYIHNTIIENEILTTTTVIYNQLMGTITTLLVLLVYILITLIVVVNITNVSKGPLRHKLMNKPIRHKHPLFKIANDALVDLPTPSTIRG
jgi:hypothetical protein